MQNLQNDDLKLKRLPAFLNRDILSCALSSQVSGPERSIKCQVAGIRSGITDAVQRSILAKDWLRAEENPVRSRFPVCSVLGEKI